MVADFYQRFFGQFGKELYVVIVDLEFVSVLGEISQPFAFPRVCAWVGQTIGIFLN